MTTKMKLPISRWFAGFGKYRESMQLSQEYVEVYSNDWHGWRILGGANYLLKNFGAAVNAYTNAVRLVDDGSCAQLALAAMKTDQNNIVRDMVPHLLELRNSTPTKFVRPLEISAALILFSIRTDQKELFVKAVERGEP